MPESVLAAVRPVFRAVACAVVPEATRLDGAAWSDLERIVDDALASRPERMRKQLVSFLRLLDVLARVRHGRALSSLDPSRRRSLLERVERARLYPLRRGMWGLRTLIFMGYYTRPGVSAELGYAADRRGWRARGGTIGVVLMPPSEVWIEPPAKPRGALDARPPTPRLHHDG